MTDKFVQLIEVDEEGNATLEKVSEDLIREICNPSPGFAELEKKILSEVVDPAPFQCTNPIQWTEYVERNKDSYGRAAIVFAARVAKGIDEALIRTNSHEGFACLSDEQIKTITHEADDYCGNITGFQAGFAFSALYKCYRFGKELCAQQGYKFEEEETNEKA